MTHFYVSAVSSSVNFCCSEILRSSSMTWSMRAQWSSVITLSLWSISVNSNIFRDKVLTCLPPLPVRDVSRQSTVVFVEKTTSELEYFICSFVVSVYGIGSDPFLAPVVPGLFDVRSPISVKIVHPLKHLYVAIPDLWF